MKRILTPLAVAALALAAACSDGGPTQHATPPAEGGAPLLRAANPVPGQYIVVLNEGANPRAVAAVAGTDPEHVYTAVVNGFSATLNAGQLNVIRRHPAVAYVEEDAVVTSENTQNNATWGLDRIDQRNLPLNQTYTYTHTGSTVHAYIIDTGIRLDHTQFTGRMGNGFDAVTSGGNANDCNGHGTHVAGTVGGTTWGVAKNVIVHPVRVLNCSGSGTNAGVIAGMDWVTNNHVKPAVANLSLGGGASSTTDAAVDRMHNAGVTVVVAAGNNGANACNYSPARAANAITVGATTSTDARASYSNFGTCLNIFAPGSSITSAWHTGSSASNSISGTSMAAPHVAGVAALYLEANPTATPTQVRNAIVGDATPGKVTSPGSGSPNLLLYSLINGSGGTPGNQPPTASFTVSCTGLSCQFTDTSTDSDGTITGRSWSFGDGTTSTATNPTKSYGSGGTYTVSLTVTDNGGATGTTSQSVTVSSPSGAPCTGCEAYSGFLSGTGAAQVHPNGDYYYSAAGTHRGWLRGPTNADFDLYLYRWNGLFWSIVARGETISSNEDVVYNGSAGYYYWRVYSYSGSGAYNFWMQRP